MTLITVTDYLTYNGETIPAAEFPRIAARASEAVEAACSWRIEPMSTAGELDEFQWKQIRLATCAQCEYLYLNGVEAALDGADGSNGYQIGKTQMIAGGWNSGGSGGQAYGGCCKKALDALIPTGLLYRGVHCR